MTLKPILFVSVLILLVALPNVYSQAQYSFTYMANGTCAPMEVGTCYKCPNNYGNPIYYQLVSYYDYYEVKGYLDSACTDFYTYGYLYDEQCKSESWSGCYFYQSLTSIDTLTLTISSSQPISVAFLGEEPIYATLAQSKATAQSSSLFGFQVRSNGHVFFVERQLSATQYSSSLGIYSLGETYTHSPFTFSVTASTLQLPVSIPSLTSVNFYPIFSVAVTSDDNTYQLYHEDDGEVIFYLPSALPDDGLNIADVTLSNPLYTVTNMTLYPPYHDDDALLVFHFESTSTPYLTVECYDDSGVFANGNSYDIYNCGFGSLSFSGIFSLSFLSFSLDQQPARPQLNADDMAFRLF